MSRNVTPEMNVHYLPSSQVKSIYGNYQLPDSVGLGIGIKHHNGSMSIDFASTTSFWLNLGFFSGSLRACEITPLANKRCPHILLLQFTNCGLL